MDGGLYRSANAARDGGRSPADDATVVFAAPVDQPVVESAAPPPEPAEPAPQPPAKDSAAKDSAAKDSAAKDSAAKDSAKEEEGSAAGHSAVMAIGSLVSRGTGFLRTAVIAAALGGGLVGDAYTTSQFFPAMVYELLLGGILTSVVVPVLVRARKTDADGGVAYTQRLLTLSVLALGGAAALAVLAAPLLTLVYAGGQTDAYQRLVTALSWLMLPMIFFYGVSALLGAVLNTRGHFAAPMWTPILNNLVVIGTAGLYIGLFGATAIRPEEMTPARILVLGGGTLAAIVLQSAGLWPALRKVGFSWRWRFDVRALGLRELGHLGGWMFCYVAVSQLGVLVLLNLLNRANKSNAAGPLIYNNVFLLLMMAHGIVAVSIITALMPRMSAAAVDRRYSDLAADLSRGTRTSTAVLAPIAVCYAVLAQPIATTLFEHGAFTRDHALSTSLVLLVAAIALVPFAVSQLFTFAFYAMPDTKTPALINIVVVVVRVGVQVALFAMFAAAFTAAGLMVGNAISYVLCVVLSAWLLRKRVGLIGLRRIGISSGKVVLAALGAAAVGLGVLAVLPGSADPTRWEALLRLVCGGAAISLTYLGLAMVLRISEITEVVRLVRRKLGR